MKKLGVPVEAKVAASFRAIWPAFPTPVTIKRPGCPSPQRLYTIKAITNDRRRGTIQNVLMAGGSTTQFTKPIDNIGNKTLPDYEGYANQHIFAITIPGCATPGKVFVGQRAEAFAVNLGEVFDLVNLVPIQGEPRLPAIQLRFAVSWRDHSKQSQR